jgi:hypothetical protein
MDVSLAEAVIPGAIAGATALGGAFFGSRYELKKVKAERFNEREKDFERAQGGYRACYRKFLVNIDGHRGKVNVATLLDNFWEASFAGDPEVIQQLEEYWPADKRAGGEAPQGPPPKALLEAMRQHGSRSLAKQLELKEGFEAKSPQ